MIKRRESCTGHNILLFTPNSKPLSSTMVCPFWALAAYHLYSIVIIICYNTTCTAKGNQMKLTDKRINHLCHTLITESYVDSSSQETDNAKIVNIIMSIY